MQKKALIKVVASVLCALMVFSAIPLTTVASLANWETENVVYDKATFGTNGYYNVISKKDYTLVPGAATETEMVINNSAGTRRQVMHVLECDPSNPDISIVPGYYNIDKDITDVNNWTAAGMTDMAAKYENELNYNVVCGMNTALAYDNNAPYSWLVYNGQVLVDRKNSINNYHSGYCQTMLCVYKDAQTGACSCELRTASQGLRGDEWQAIGANFGMVVNNGQLVSKTEERTTSAAARSMIGVKEDGTLVLVMNDGRGANNSVGFCTYELGESMLALGCKWAFNCDGGGSSGFVSKRAGETEVTMRSVPCDGAERPTLNGVFIVSNVGPTGELNNVNINSDYDYFAPGTSYTFDTEAIDTHGYAMDMPADVSWALSDASFGTVNNGTFTSNGTTGDVDVQVVSGGNVVGTRTIHVANPATLSLSASETTLPYSTADKVRTTNIPMVAKTGENDVYTTGAYNISVSPANGGTVDGLKFTATDDTSVSQAVVTINYAPTNQSFTYTVNYGKGSEVLWDFEDGDISAWVGTEQAEQMMRDHGCPVTTYGDWSTPFKTLESGGQISWSNKTTTKLSSVAEGGQAHSGDKSLAVTFDMKNTEFNSWVYSIIWNMQGNVVLRDVANGNNATAFGCWVYIPKGFYTAKNNGAQALQLTVQRGTSSTAALTGNQLNLQYNGKNINALKEADIPENRWVYVKADLTAYNYVKLVDPYNDVYRSPSFIRMYVKPSEAQEMTYYFDDWTLDYSSAVDDRQPPVISNPTYCTNDTNIAFDNQTITTNVVSFDANIADTVASNAEGLDYNTAKIYVDGIAQRNVRASGNTMGVQNVVLSNGVHNIKFEIADKLGNSTTLTKTLTVNADGAKPAVRLAGHNDKNNAIETGSVYYVDVKADNIESIDSVTTTVELQSAHEWELDHMIVAKGFEATYELNSVKDNIATITITKTGATDLTGEQTLVSLPARVWSFDESTEIGGDGKAPTHMTAAQRYASSYGEPVLMMEANVLYGEVGYTDNTAGTFGGSISEATAVTGNKTKAWHEHDAELTVQNKDATCTEDGYTNRTYCETCGSVVDWGTKVPATGHDYELVDGKFVCSKCGVEYKLGTGLVHLNGKTYYAIGGNLVTGWQQVDEDWYLFQNDFSAYVGDYKFKEGVTYHFNDDGAMESGVWNFDGTGYRYYYGPDYYKCRAANPHSNTFWVDIKGDRYAFDRKGYRHNGISMIYESNNAPEMYEFTEDGKLIGKYESDYTGLYKEQYVTTYLKNGVPYAAGLIKDNGDYYYISSGYIAVTGNYVITRTNGLLQSGMYQFDEDGKMIDPPAELNGPQPNGTFYKDGTQIMAYRLAEYNGNWYFINDYNKIARNVTLYLAQKFVDGTKFAPGYYRFDADGKMEIPEEKNGPKDDGYFYINGVKQNAYQLIEYQGEYYFINDGHKYAKNIRLYLSEKFTEGSNLKPGYYNFDDSGKIILKNGPQDDGYFYLKGERQNSYQLIKYNDDYYFINDGNKYAKNIRLYLSQKFVDGSDLPAGYYYFDEAGKIIIKNGPQDDGYFYLNGVRQNAYQLIKYENNYYFINDAHKYAKNTRLYLSQKFVDGSDLPVGYYNFDETGKIIIKNGPQDDGYFYRNGTRVNAYQLVEYDNEYYFINDYNKYAVNKRLYLSDKFVDGTPFAAGYYQFDAEGKMIIKNGPQEDGSFYLNGVMQKAYQLILYKGDYYFVYDGHKIAKDKYLYVKSEFLEGTYLREWYYDFGPDGKMTGFIDGIPNGRDIGDIYYIKTTSGKDIKSGKLVRGGELDNAVYHFPEAYLAKGIETLKNDYKIKTDMDLRGNVAAGHNVLGDGVQHKTYDMVYYDEIFTDEGKAKVKQVFDDLCNPDNYPIYLHCTHGVDRAGTVMVLLNAALGIPEKRIYNEYMLSVGGYGGDAKKIVTGLKSKYKSAGSNVNVCAIAFLKDCGITQEQLDTLFDIYIED